MNSITEFLDLEDDTLKVDDISISGSVKTITVSTDPYPHFCPACQSRMYSKGIRDRTIQHPVLQDHYNVVLVLKQRRWRCTNKACNYEANEEFKFVNPRRRTTNATDMLIVQAFQDFSISASEIARRFNTSDTHVMEVFDRYVHLDRLQLPEIISVDEVNIDLDPKCKYALIIQDFVTGDPVDLLVSRRSDITEPYFVSIPLEERRNVKYLISDMYKPYISYVSKYFPNAVSVVDAFHVVQWMNSRIDNYIRSLVRQYRTRDLQNYHEKHPEGAKPPLSDEVYLLTRYRWLILQSQKHIVYHSDARMDKHFHRLMNTYDYEDALFQLAPRLQTLRELKEMYMDFNSANAGKPDTARTELDKLIEKYKSCGDSIFVDFAHTLENFKDSIVNSFIMVKKVGNGGMYDSRLSNGPMESLNRIPKDMKRNGRGYTNPDHFRNRFLYAARSNPILNGTGKREYTNYDMSDDAAQGDENEQ